VVDTSNVLGVILGGGQGTRLYPLTRERAKPAVPIASKYRLIDLPISNCLNSGIRRMYLLTQFLSVSLHRHIAQTYKFDIFSGGSVYILAAQQTARGMDWYQGTADAVRKQLARFTRPEVEDVLILSGDHLYRMDYRPYIEMHRQRGADVTIAVQPASAHDATRMGILETDREGLISLFVEKPPADQLAGLESVPGSDKPYLASMGIYLFKAHVMKEMLEASDAEDFGRQIIPEAIEKASVWAYPFDGYWADIGTIEAFYDANLGLTAPVPQFNFYDADNPIYTRPRFLPSTRADGCTVMQSMIADGCLVQRSTIEGSVIGLRSVIEPDVGLHHAITMGADWYETESDRARNREQGIPDIGIGAGSRIERAIVDKNARIGRGVLIRDHHGDPDSEVEGMYAIRDGIAVIEKNAIIPDGTEL